MEAQAVKHGEEHPQQPPNVPPTYQPSYVPPTYQPPYVPPTYQPPYVPTPYPNPPYPTPYKPYQGYVEGYIETPTPEYLAGSIGADIVEFGGVKPTTIIRTDTDWAIRIKWSLTGTLAPLICGEWCVHAFLESMGPGPELRLPSEREEIRIPLDPCGDGKCTYDFRIPRGTVKAEHCGIPYKLVVSLTYYDQCNRPGPMAGFVELPMVQFYEPAQGKTSPVPPVPGPIPPFPLP